MDLQKYSWPVMQEIINALDNKEVPSSANGVKALYEKWMQKSWMFPYFDEMGRVEMTVPATVGNEDMTSAFNEAQRISKVLAAKPKYSEILESDLGDTAFRFFKLYLRNNFKTSEIVENKLEDKQDDPTHEGRVLPKGTKLTKYIAAYLGSDPTIWNKENGIFGKYSEESKPLIIEFVMDVYSQMISLIKRGEDHVVLSINPVDIVFASYHTTGKPPWRSCHNLVNGEYRTGPLSYLCDGISAVAFAYRYNDQVELIPDVAWPRKMWRAMVFLDKDRYGAAMSREYPSGSPAYARAARVLACHQLYQHALTKHASNAVDDYFLKVTSGNCCYREDDSHDSSGGEYKVDGSKWHYRDDPHAVIRLKNIGQYPRVKPGTDELPCLHCGTLRKVPGAGKKQFCSACDPIPHCARCGHEGETRNFKKGLDGQWYCNSCWDALYVRCEYCNEIHERTDMVAVGRKGQISACKNCVPKHFVQCPECEKWFTKEEVATTTDGETFCLVCIQKRASKCDHCGKWYAKSEHFTKTGDGYVLCNECLESSDDVHRCSSCGKPFMQTYLMAGDKCFECASAELMADDPVTENIEEVPA